jgi:hypothetical protein
MWDPQRLTTLWASTACYRDSFTFLPTQSLNKELKKEGNNHPSSRPNAAKTRDEDPKESQPLHCNSFIYLVQSYQFDKHP